MTLIKNNFTNHRNNSSPNQLVSIYFENNEKIMKIKLGSYEYITVHLCNEKHQINHLNYHGKKRISNYF